MRAVVQRVSSAKVTVGGEEVPAIGPGLLVLLGVRTRRHGRRSRPHGPQADRAAGLRGRRGPHEPVAGGRRGDVLCVSNFTVYGDARRGNRPSFVEAAAPEEAEPLYERVRAALGAAGWRFGARMAVELVNDGPVTVIVDT